VSWNQGLAISMISVEVDLAILELLARDDRLAVDRIADSLGAPQNVVASAMRRLARQGFVRRVGATGWALTDAGRDEVRHWRIA